MVLWGLPFVIVFQISLGYPKFSENFVLLMHFLPFFIPRLTWFLIDLLLHYSLGSWEFGSFNHASPVSVKYR